jgi:nitrite reductase/ring-hydroxylating ferredoxin subunit
MMAEEVHVGSVDDFEEGVIHNLIVGEEEIGVVRWLGRFYAFNNQCPHWGVSLSDGYLSGASQIACSHHDSAFDLATGAVLMGPADQDLPIFGLRVEGSSLLLESKAKPGP